mgnify:CR=1 FL=1
METGVGKLSFKEVVQTFEKTQDLANAPLTYIAVICWTIIGIAIFYHVIRDRRSLSSVAVGIRVISLAAVGFITFHLYTTISEYDYSLDEEKWKQDYLLAYLDSQPEERLAIEQVEATNTDGDKAIPSMHLKKESPTVHVKFLTIGKNGDEQELSTQVKIKHVQADTAPYLTYKTIKEELSSQYRDDMYYETTLYINQDSNLYK